MQTLFESHEVLKSYDRAIKIRNDGTLELKIYDSKIVYQDSNYEKFDKTFIDICDFDKKNKIDMCITSKKNECVKDVKKDCEQLSGIRGDSLTRSRQTLIDYASENNDKFNSFITLTFGDNITDVELANKSFQNWCRQIRRYCSLRDKEFYYLGVPEFQKSGRVHYHVLTSLEHDIDILKQEPIKTYNKEKKKYYNIEYYNIPYWNYGYSSSFDLKSQTDDNFNLALYIIKYLYKDLDTRLFGRKKILKSNNLVKPNLIKLEKDNIVWQTAYRYIQELIENKKIDVQSINRIERTEDKPYIKSQFVMCLKLQDKDNILKEILQDKLEF